MTALRGLHAFKSIAPHFRTQTRNISIARPITTRSRLGTNTPFITRSAPRLTSAILSTHFIRNASTIPTSQTAIVPPTTPSSNIDTITLDDIDFSAPASSAVEGIGYLKEIGLDYGWGPTAVVEWTLEHLHITAGLPWWGAIIAASVTFRLLTFPLFLKSADTAARTAALHTVFEPIQARIKKYQQEGDTQAAAMEMRALLASRKQAGLLMRHQLYPAIAQMVIGFCGFRLLSAMSALPVPSLKEGGFLWLTDLTIPDGFLIIPTLLALFTHATIRLGGETGSSANQMAAGMQKFMLWGLPGIVFFITAWQSGALCVWFLTSTCMALLQASILQNNTLRMRLGLPPIYVRPKTSPVAETSNTSQAFQGYARPQYQAPSLRRTQGIGNVIDTTLATPSKDSTPTPATPKSKQPGIFDSAKNILKQTIEEDKKKRLQKHEAKMKENAIKSAFQKRRER